MRETEIKVLHQGSVAMAHNKGYMLVGDGDAVCFNIDPIGRALVCASTTSDDGCPIVFLSSDDDGGEFTQIEFPEFKGWRFHAGGDGKSIAIALRRDF